MPISFLDFLDLEDIKPELIAEVEEEIINTLPIYKYEIMNEFSKLTYWEIDEIVQNSGYIEYNPENGFEVGNLDVGAEIEVTFKVIVN